MANRICFLIVFLILGFNATAQLPEIEFKIGSGLTSKLPYSKHFIIKGAAQMGNKKIQIVVVKIKNFNKRSEELKKANSKWASARLYDSDYFWLRNDSTQTEFEIEITNPLMFDEDYRVVFYFFTNEEKRVMEEQHLATLQEQMITELETQFTENGEIKLTDSKFELEKRFREYLDAQSPSELKEVLKIPDNTSGASGKTTGEIPVEIKAKTTDETPVKTPNASVKNLDNTNKSIDSLDQGIKDLIAILSAPQLDNIIFTYSKEWDDLAKEYQDLTVLTTGLKDEQLNLGKYKTDAKEFSKIFTDNELKKAEYAPFISAIDKLKTEQITDQDNFISEKTISDIGKIKDKKIQENLVKVYKFYIDITKANKSIIDLKNGITGKQAEIAATNSKIKSTALIQYHTMGFNEFPGSTETDVESLFIATEAASFGAIPMNMFVKNQSDWRFIVSTGVKFYFYPVDKSQRYPYKGLHYLSITRSSFVIGAVLSPIKYKGQEMTKLPFINANLYAGLGYDINKYFAISTGAVFFMQPSVNSESTTDYFRASPYITFSFQIDLIERIRQMATKN